MKRLLLLPLLALFFAACNKGSSLSENTNNPTDTMTKWNNYLIKTGQNYCQNNTYEIIQGVDKIDFNVIFDSSCIYQNVDPINQYDINKLMGFSDCYTHHQTNSARFGWNWLDDSLRLYAYCYIDSVRTYKSLGAVTLNQPHHLNMYVKGTMYYFEINGRLDSMQRGCSGNTITGYKLLPYFGGDEVAPHDITIKIKYN